MASKAEKEKEKEKETKAAEEKKKAEEKKPPTPLEVLYKNIERIVKGVNTRDRALFLRVLRCTVVVRCGVGATALAATVDRFVTDADLKSQILQLIDAIAKHDAVSGDTEMKDDAASGSGAGAGAGSSGAAAAAAATPAEPSPPTVGAGVVEVAFYLYNLVISFLVKRKLWSQVGTASAALIARANVLNKRTLDIFGGRAWSTLSLACEKLGTLASIRNDLHDAHRTACLRHDEMGQAVLLNLLTRNYLLFNMTDQASKLISRASFPESISNSQFVRHLYYKGRIQAVQLDYSDALMTLMHADRKAPSTGAKGFRAQVKKVLVIVQLLLGEVPERSVFMQSEFKAVLAPYLSITQAVRVGDLAAFNDVVSRNEAVFRADSTLALITRLRQNVIKTGLKKIALSYSRISFVDIARKLHLGSSDDAQFLCAKAIRDGVIDATMNYADGWLSSKEVVDVYSTTEPQVAFDRRIRFCLEVHNDAVKAMKYPADLESQRKEDLERLEREKDETQLAEELEEMEDDGDGDL